MVRPRATGHAVSSVNRTWGVDTNRRIPVDIDWIHLVAGPCLVDAAGLAPSSDLLRPRDCPSDHSSETAGRVSACGRS